MNPARSRSIRRVLPLLPLVLVAVGCVTASAEASVATYHYEKAAGIIALLIGLLLLPAGGQVRKQSRGGGIAVMIAGPLVGAVIGGSLLLERVHVTDDGFAVHSGILGSTANLEIAFDDVKSVRILEERTSGRHGRDIEVLRFSYGQGEATRWELNNGVKIEAAFDIVARLEARGVPIGQGR